MADAATPPQQSAAVRVAEIEGRGRGVVSTQPLRGGDIVLRDSPILLYCAFPLLSPPPATDQDKEKSYCSHCFRSIAAAAAAGGPCPCPWCSASLFCSCNCRSAALSSSHTQWVCQALNRLRHDNATNSPLFNKDRQVQARFLVAAYNLALISPSNFQILLSLQGDHTSSGAGDDGTPLFLHSLISSICPPPPLDQNQIGVGFCVEVTAALIAKDKLNAFGLMEPFASDKVERSVRAYGIYPMASFFNHDCLPNACRFDYVDATAPPGNTDIIVRLIHDVPQGRELCLSYFPVNLKYSGRQRRLKEDYGFSCECDRCRVEASWSDHEDDEHDEDDGMEEDEDEEEEAAMDEDDMKGENSNAVNADSDFPHAYFFLRYMCNKDNCWGTLAPLPSTHTTCSPTLMECNVCGNLSNCNALADDNLPETH